MFLLRPFRLFAKALTIDATPQQMALGMSFGMLVGLVPKGNLLAAVLMIILCSLRINLAVGLMAAFVFSWSGILLDPTTHQIGQFLLKHESLQGFWTQLYDMSVVPWTNFNNTIVMGSFTLGLGLFLPVYFLSRPFFAITTPRLSAWVKRFRLVSLLWGGEITGKLT
jgi:uncharacterized protein (TIGR03546 family)